ncbi:hypothetical protein BH24ACT6_BH24ACT6_03550 [soil metagenome]|jgi:plasmid stability protein
MRWYARSVRQTLVQLTDELVAALDRRAAHDGISRSRLVRDLLGAALSSDQELDRALIAGYESQPQSDGADAWGDLAAWSEMNARRTLASLNEEDGGW